VGIAGPRMRQAGCHGLFDMTEHARMLLSVLGSLGRGLHMVGVCKACLERLPIDATVVIDSPLVHLHVAGLAHRRRIPVMYYVAPQLWAWGAKRMDKVRERVDRLAVLWPFEVEFFAKHNVPATLVGHPMFDEDLQQAVDAELAEEIRRSGDPIIAMLPGSREPVVEAVLQGQLEVATAIKERFPKAAFVVSAANDPVARIIEAEIRSVPLPVTMHREAYRTLIATADLVLAASGTVTLEVAAQHKPMVVMYQASRLMYNLVGRWVVKTKLYSLPNVLAQRVIVPEFMPYYRSTEPIAREALDILSKPQRQQQMIQELREITEPLRHGDSAGRAAEELLAMLGEQPTLRPSV
jgi:lipid-A-disaccharide synthase